jgi:hypothetical protein
MQITHKVDLFHISIVRPMKTSFHNKVDLENLLYCAAFFLSLAVLRMASPLTIITTDRTKTAITLIVMMAAIAMTATTTMGEPAPPLIHKIVTKTFLVAAPVNLTK